MLTTYANATTFRVGQTNIASFIVTSIIGILKAKADDDIKLVIARQFLTLARLIDTR